MRPSPTMRLDLSGSKKIGSLGIFSKKYMVRSQISPNESYPQAGALEPARGARPGAAAAGLALRVAGLDCRKVVRLAVQHGCTSVAVLAPAFMLDLLWRHVRIPAESRTEGSRGERSSSSSSQSFGHHRGAAESKPAAHSRPSEKDPKLAQKLGQLEPFIAAFPQKCVGQLV